MGQYLTLFQEMRLGDREYFYLLLEFGDRE